MLKILISAALNICFYYKKICFYKGGFNISPPELDQCVGK